MTGQVVRALSFERLAPYVAAMGNVRGGLRLYEWNLAVSASFFEDLSHLEVALRNTIHHQLMLLMRREDWWRSPTIVLGHGATNMLASAQIQAAVRVGGRPGDVVAALSFGFWVSLLSSGGSAAYETQFWRPALHRAFPDYSGPRPPLHRKIENMRLLRNRIAHHEPIHYRHLAADHARLLTIVGWISGDFADWVAARSRVPALLMTKPAR